MRPYKLKHIPTGLYFQPHKHRGSHLSRSGKIYQTNLNGFSGTNGKVFRVMAKEGSKIQRDTETKLAWTKSKWAYSSVEAFTLLTDWVREEI